MKSKKYLLSILSIFALASCEISLVKPDSNSASEENSQSEVTSESANTSETYSEENSSESETVSSTEELSSTETESTSIPTSTSTSEEKTSPSVSEKESESVSVPTLETPTHFYAFDSSDITATYEQGETFLIKSWTNYIVLDSEGRIFYTVANAGCGYGTNGNYACVEYYRSKVESYIKDGYFEIPASMTGYSISYQAYGEFSNDVSNGSIGIDEFKDYGYEATTRTWNSSSNQYIDTYLGIQIGNTEPSTSITAKNDEVFRLSSITDVASSSGTTTYKVKVPYDDTYSLSCSKATKIELYDANGALIKSGTTSLSTKLTKNQIVYLKIVSTASTLFSLACKLSTHVSEMPYELNSSVDTSTLSTTSSSTSSPLKACNIQYNKRSDDRGLYINSNNPEALSTSNLNQCLTSNDITEKDVFFTFEHNNISTNYYYGYRVTNTGTDDLYITVKNLGYQVSGAGSWLGEDEWIKFYNTKFYSDTSSYSTSQKSNYNAYVGFSNSYTSSNRQPITYVIPSGKYIYVMGGTTSDSYKNINVFSSADVTVNGGCSNGAVLFSTYGSSAKGEFVVYNNVSTLKTNISKESQVGYVGDSTYGSQYIGYDNCHGVVDADLTWTFNDATKAQDLPVSYSNPYYISSTSNRTGTRYNSISSSAFSTKTYSSATTWYTHINPNNTASAVGTDMTSYVTVDSVSKKAITIDYLHYDGKGNIANIGNWMVDYIDNITLVNQGSKDRTFTYKLTHNGVILAFIRNSDGSVNSSVTPKYYTSIASSTYGAEIRDYFTYTVTIPAHSYVAFSVDYNLLANSNGCIGHIATLN